MEQRLKECLARNHLRMFEESKIRHCSCTGRIAGSGVFFDPCMNERTGQWPKISGRVIWWRSERIGPSSF